MTDCVNEHCSKCGLCRVDVRTYFGSTMFNKFSGRAYRLYTSVYECPNKTHILDGHSQSFFTRFVTMRECIDNGEIENNDPYHGDYM